MTYKFLQVIHSTAAHYAHYVEKHYDRSRFSVDILNVDETPESALLERGPDYDFIHFWVDVKPEILRALRASTKSLISITNGFGDPLPGFKDEPWDTQVHVTMSAYAKYARIVGSDTRSLFPRNVVNYLPVDTEAFDPQKVGQASLDRMRSSLGIRDDDVVISRTGRPDIWKWDVFPVHVLKKLHEFGIRAKYLVVGGVPSFLKRELLRKGLYQHVVEVPFERYKPGVDIRTASILGLSQAYVHSAFIGESCGMSILEAMSMERPVLVTNKPWADNAPPEYIADGSNGFLCSSVDDCARLMRRLLLDEKMRQAVGRRARETVVRMFDAAKGTKYFEAMYTTPQNRWNDVLRPNIDDISRWAEGIAAKRASEAAMRRISQKALFLAGVRLRRLGQFPALVTLSNAVHAMPKPRLLRDDELVL